MIDERDLLERALHRFEPQPGLTDRVYRRRERKRRNQRIGAGALAIILALVSFVALTRAFHGAERPASEPTPTPEGIFSEVGGWIAYGNDSGIWALDPAHPGDPEGQIQLSPEPGTPVAWSSDGSKLFILRFNPVPSALVTPGEDYLFFSGYYDLFVLNADGTETRLTNDGPVLGGGSVSPDGSKVVYAVNQDRTNHRRIYVVDASTGIPQTLLTVGKRRIPGLGMERIGLSLPTFSPDGSKIAYFDGLGEPNWRPRLQSWSLRVMNADGSGSRVLFSDAQFAGSHIGHLVWSPDGTRLAFDVDGEIYTVGADGSGLTQLTRLTHYVDIVNLVWSPDGARLAFGSRGFPRHGIYVVAADGSGLTLAIPDGLNPYWSPDGSSISYQHSDRTMSALGTLEIAAPDGTHVQRFGYGASGPWNPLVQSEPEVAPEPAAAELPAPSQGLTLTSTLLLIVALLALVAGAVLNRLRMMQRP